MHVYNLLKKCLNIWTFLHIVLTHNLEIRTTFLMFLFFRREMFGLVTTLYYVVTTTGTTSLTGIDYPSGAHPWFCVGFQSLIFWVVLCPLYCLFLDLRLPIYDYWFHLRYLQMFLRLIWFKSYVKYAVIQFPSI